MMNDTETAYLAALFDVKAAFAINPIRPRQESYESFAAHLTITTKRIELVEYLSAFGSKVLENSKSFRIYWNYQEMHRVLQMVLPFMRFQRQQAEVVLAFLRRTGIPQVQSAKVKELNSLKYQRGGW
jgi:hypothetical protein